MAVLTIPNSYIPLLQSVNGYRSQRKRCGQRWYKVASQQQELCTEFERIRIDKSALKIEEACSHEELWATSLLRVRSFYDFKSTFGVEVS